MRSAYWWLAGAAFVLLATANGAGYRFGVSDQAFYIPVVARALDAAAFPRDAALIDAQGHLMIADEALAAIVRTTGASIETVFLAGYLLSMALMWAGIVLVGRRVYRHAWLVAALGAALTLRHRIPRTSANSLEPYFHPRMLAFALGVLAVAAVLRRRVWTAVALGVIAAAVHPTTALWFAVLVGTAAALVNARVMAVVHRIGWRPLLGGALAAAYLILPSVLPPMDQAWLSATASKDSLLPSDWPAWAWMANLGLAGVLWWAHRVRRARGEATADDTALVSGALALAAVFALTLPLVLLRLAFMVQLQISRVFWLVDLVATVYVLALFDRSARAARIAAVVLLAASVGRGAYIMTVERPDRPLFAVHLPASAWQDAMEWLSQQPLDAHVLADPGHAWKYGTSVRVSAGRDVFLEEVKDAAIAIYSRDVARRVVERTAAIGDFPALTAARARDLAGAYDLDYLVTEADLALPLAYRNAQFRIYHLDPPDDPGAPREAAAP